MLRSASWKTVSVGEWPGRKCTSSLRSRSSISLAVVQRARHVGPRAPARESARHRLERGHHVLRDPVAEHHVASEVVLGLGLLGVVRHERDRGVDRGHLGAGVRGHQRHQPEVVDVLVGEDRPARCPRSRGRAPPGRAGARPATCPSWAPRRPASAAVLDQVDVDPPHRERRGDGEPVDAEAAAAANGSSDRSTADQREHLVALAPPCAPARRSDSRLSRSSGSVFEGRTLKCQSS